MLAGGGAAAAPPDALAAWRLGMRGRMSRVARLEQVAFIYDKFSFNILNLNLSPVLLETSGRRPLICKVCLEALRVGGSCVRHHLSHYFARSFIAIHI